MNIATLPKSPSAKIAVTKPRVAFVGTGWIGRNRMECLLAENIIEPYAVVDNYLANAEAACEIAPGIPCFNSLDELLATEPDGVVIATPSALHAQQTLQCLSANTAVFCQKPLGRNSEEVEMVIDAARKNNLLLHVDLSYRFTKAISKIRELIQSGKLGEIYAVNLIFHNAYGPDKKWFYDPQLSGGGCLIDLGVHLIDLALWLLDFPPVKNTASQLFAKGKTIAVPANEVEDYACAQIELSTQTAIQLACSWNLPAGKDAVIEASFYGTKGGASFKNTGGSFYDFTAEHFTGTAKETLAAPPDAWGGRAIINWGKKLAAGKKFDEEIPNHIQTTKIIDEIYGR